MTDTESSALVLIHAGSDALRAVLCDAVTGLGYQPVVAASLAQARPLLRASRPVLMLLQTPLSSEDAVEFERISHDPALEALPCIMMTETTDHSGLPAQLARVLSPRAGLADPHAALEANLGHSVRADVIVVEDNIAELEILLRRLGRAGLRGCAATSGREALWLIRRQRPRLMILDLALPGGDGFEVVAQLRRDPAWARLPVLVFTALTLQNAQRALLTLGPTQILAKNSSTAEQFMAAVQELLPKE